MSNVILIMGMHRSGTSAMAGVCNILGVDLGKGLIGSDAFNPKGHWEHEEMVLIHRSILRDLGRSAGCVHALLPEKLKSRVLADIKRTIGEAIDKDFYKVRLWAVKDPEISRLIPFWLPPIQQRNISPKFLIMVRHPYEVARSLHNRNGFTLRKSLLLWLRYTLEAERSTRGLHRSIITHRFLMADWRTVVLRIQTDLGLMFPRKVATVAPQVDAFLDKGLWHHQQDTLDGASCALGTMAMEVYMALSLNHTAEINRVADSAMAALDVAEGQLRHLPLYSGRDSLAKEIRSVYRGEKLKYVVNSSRKISQVAAVLSAVIGLAGAAQ